MQNRSFKGQGALYRKAGIALALLETEAEQFLLLQVLSVGLHHWPSRAFSKHVICLICAITNAQNICITSKDSIQAMINADKSDSTLEEHLRAAAVGLDAFVAIAKQAGFVVTKEELRKAQGSATQELSDEELETVAGGLYKSTQPGQCDGSAKTGHVLFCRRKSSFNLCIYLSYVVALQVNSSIVSLN